MRTLKYKIYNKNTGKYLNQCGIGRNFNNPIGNNEFTLDVPEDEIWYESTGFKDLYGRDIFENDIISIYGVRFRVIWELGSWRICFVEDTENTQPLLSSVSKFLANHDADDIIIINQEQKDKPEKVVFVHCEHEFKYDGAGCIHCGKTVSELLDMRVAIGTEILREIGLR